MTYTIQAIVDRILDDIPDAPLENTVDTFKAGDPSQPVTSIVTTFCASVDVIRKAAALGANFIITHEPTYYNGADDLEWVAETPAYQEKRRLLNETGMTLWRFHDHWHHHRPDGILTGVLRQLGWENALQTSHWPPVVTLSPRSLHDFVMEVKTKLGIQSARVIGNLDMHCEHIAVVPGAPEGKWQTLILAREDVDVLLTGEVREWEVTEYARDAVAFGQHKALVVLGHALSEEPGMAYLVEWLQARFPDLTITHLPTGAPFETI